MHIIKINIIHQPAIIEPTYKKYIMCMNIKVVYKTSEQNTNQILKYNSIKAVNTPFLLLRSVHTIIVLHYVAPLLSL